MPQTVLNSIGKAIKTATGQSITSASAAAKTAVNKLITSPGIDINGLKSAVEGKASELNGAISSLSGSVPTVADSLMDTSIQQLLNSSVKQGPIGLGNPPWNNVLENFATVNYIWTLSCLTIDELNRPDATYRLYGPKHIVCRSGGSGSSKVKTASELALGTVEFYIDDIDMQTVITHNKGTKQADAIGGSFKIFEPYSMGLFYETLQIAAKECGYKNYIDAPFMISLQFKGWDDLGNITVAPRSTRYFPVHLINSTFNVTEQGSTYDVQFVKHNDLTFGDQNQSIKTDVSLSGNTVQELLQTGARSLATVINTRLLKSKEAKQSNKVDQYIIMFPTTRSSKIEAILGKPSEAATGATTSVPKEGEVKTLSAARKQELFESVAGTNSIKAPAEIDKTVSSLLGITIQRSEVGETIRTFAENPENTNAIGNSKIVKSKNDAGTKATTDPALCIVNDNKQGVICRSKVQEPTTARVFQFTAGTKIQDIIEDLIIASDWGRGIKARLNAPDKYNMVDWFKIESQVYEVHDEKTVAATGKNPKTYVFRVVPYKVNAIRFAAVSKPLPRFAELKAQAAKEYNYIYTGKNKDVIDFDIQFNTAFFVGIGVQKGQATKDAKTGSQTSKVTADKEVATQLSQGSNTAVPTNGIAPVGELSKNLVKSVGGGGQEWTETQIARQFNASLLDSPADLIKVDLKIWGDPFWLSDSGVGNYTAEETDFINITKDGSVDTQSSEVDCILNFGSPFDINESGYYEFGGKTVPTKFFSGLYQCIGVKSSFAGGKFEQTLQLVRRRNQDEKIIAAEKAAAKLLANKNSDPKALRQGTTPAQVAARQADKLATAEANRANAIYNESSGSYIDIPNDI